MVHCEQGHRRSPAAVLAWMVTLPEYSDVHKAIKLFSNSYTGRNGNEWGKVYTEERPDWVEKLALWAKNWKNCQIEWIKSNESISS